MPATIRPELLDSVIQQESGGNPNAVSPKGAIGLMQIMPAVAKDYGVDPSTLTDPKVNRDLGTRYLGDLVDRYGGDERRALIAYNQGPNRQGILASAANYADRVLHRAGRWLAGPQPAEPSAATDDSAGHAYVNAQEESTQSILAALSQQQNKPSQPTAEAPGPPESKAAPLSTLERIRMLSDPNATEAVWNDTVNRMAAWTKQQRDDMGKPLDDPESVKNAIGTALSFQMGMEDVGPKPPVSPGIISRLASRVWQKIAGGSGELPEVAATGAEVPTAASEAPGATTPAEPAKPALGTILDAQGNPIPSTTKPPVELSESAVVQEPEAVTPQTAARTLAQKQIDALKTAKVGQSVATEFGKPEIATTIPEEDTLAQAQALRNAVEPKPTGEVKVEAPTMAAETAAKAVVYQDEMQGMIHEARGVIEKSLSGADTTQEQENLYNKFSAFAQNYANFAGMRSDVGRALDILNPLKPGNALVSAGARLAQRLTDEMPPGQVVGDLASLTTEGAIKQARQIAEVEQVAKPGDIWGAWMEYYKGNLLSNPRTMLRVPLANAVTTLMEVPVRAMAAMQPGGGAEGVNWREPWYMLQGLRYSYQDAWDYSKMLATQQGEVEFPGTGGTPYQGASPKITAVNMGLDPEGPLGQAIDYLGQAIRVPFRMLRAAHGFGQVMAGGAQTYALAIRRASSMAESEGLEGAELAARRADLFNKLVQDLPSDLVAQAQDFRNLVTMNSELGPTGQLFGKLAKIPGLDMIMPFFRVSANMIKYGTSFLGSQILNPPTPEWLGGHLGSDFYATGPVGQIARARVALGSSIIAPIIAHEVAQGTITGEGSYMTPAAREAAMREGWQPYSIRIGGHYVSMPVGIRETVGLVANTAEALHNLDEPNGGQLAMAVLMGVGQALTSSPVLRGLKDVLDLIDNPQGLTTSEKAEKFLADRAAGMVPAAQFLKGVAKAGNENVPNPSGEPTSFSSGVWNHFKAQFPVLQDSLPIDIDIYGNQKWRMPGVPQNLIFPISIMKEQHNLTDDEIIATNAQFRRPPKWIGGQAEQEMSSPGDPAVGVPLTVAQQERWAQLRGEGMRNALTAQIKSPVYQSLGKEGRRNLLQMVGETQATVASARLLGEDRELMKLYMQRMSDKNKALYAPAEEPGMGATGFTGGSTGAEPTTE